MEGINTEVQILHICPDFPFTKLYDLLFSQLSEKLHNMVYAPVSRKEIPTEYPVIWGRDFSVVDRLLFYRKQHFIFKDIKKKGLCDSKSLIHAHTLFSAGYSARKLSREYGIPYIVAIRNTDVNVFFHYMIHLRSIGVNVMRDAAAIVFLSPSYKKLVLDKYVPRKYRETISAKSFVIPNGIDTLFLDNPGYDYKELLPTKQIRLIYIGEVNKNKNVATTLKACELLEQKGVDPVLTIVGKISDKQFEWVKENRFVHYCPQSPKEVVIDYLRSNDIFVMPSITETFGLVYVEAMSQGLPIIYSKGQGIDGYFEEGYVGYHVESRIAEEIAKGVEFIVHNYSRMSSNCIEASKSFSWDSVAEKYISLYNLIINQ